jgi:hypothetical protein
MRGVMIRLVLVTTCVGYLSNVVVSVLATGPKGCGFSPGQGDGFLMVIKIHSTPSFGWEIKPGAPCHKFYGMLKNLALHN